MGDVMHKGLLASLVVNVALVAAVVGTGLTTYRLSERLDAVEVAVEQRPERGPVGPQGPPGPAGPSGSDGFDGSAGEDGSDGEGVCPFGGFLRRVTVVTGVDYGFQIDPDELPRLDVSTQSVNVCP